ncbi:hypothetical protein DWZ53_07095 [Coprobacillus sp. AF33-1AC]|nr:hypothetical protein DWZ53_07095 [Coprobacillus sp. AF33-1AC]
MFKMKTLNKIKMSFAMNAILALIIGLLFIVNPHDSFTIITMICGIYIVVKGMIDLVYYYHSWLEPFFLTSTLLNGIIKCVIGIFILTHISAMTILFSYMLSLFIIIDGIYCLEAYVFMRSFTQETFKIDYLLSWIVIICGIVLFFMAPDTIMSVSYVIGGLLVIYGVMNLIIVGRLSHIVRKYKNLIE